MSTSSFDIDEFEMQVELQQDMNRDKLNKETMSMIHPDVSVQYNSLNVLVSNQGGGKTFTACKECAKISQVDPHAHMLIIICKAENHDDPTIDIFKPLIHIPIIYLSEDEAEEYMKNLYEYKRAYNQIKENNLETKIVDDQVAEILDALKVDDFSKDYLHTLVIVNDSAKSKLFKTGSYFSHMIALGRHTQTTTFLNIQFWKGLTPEVKANISTAFVFGGFSRQQLVHILSQLPSQYDYKEIYNIYRTLSKHQKLIFNNGDVTLG